MIKVTETTIPTSIDDAEFDSTFLDFIFRRELRLPYCAACGTLMDLAQRVCRRDLSIQVDWRPASGIAHLYSYVVYRRQYSPAFAVPYSVAWVELEEGPRLISTVAAARESGLTIGMALHADFDDGGRLIFRPVAEMSRTS